MSHLKGHNHRLSHLGAAWGNLTPAQAADVSAEPCNSASPWPLHHPTVLPTPAKIAHSFSFQLATIPLMCWKSTDDNFIHSTFPGLTVLVLDTGDIQGDLQDAFLCSYMYWK